MNLLASFFVIVSLPSVRTLGLLTSRLGSLQPFVFRSVYAFTLALVLSYHGIAWVIYLLQKDELDTVPCTNTSNNMDFAAPRCSSPGSILWSVETREPCDRSAGIPWTSPSRSFTSRSAIRDLLPPQIPVMRPVSPIHMASLLNAGAFDRVYVDEIQLGNEVRLGDEDSDDEPEALREESSVCSTQEIPTSQPTMTTTATTSTRSSCSSTDEGFVYAPTPPMPMSTATPPTSPKKHSERAHRLRRRSLEVLKMFVAPLRANLAAGNTSSPKTLGSQERLQGYDKPVLSYGQAQAESEMDSTESTPSSHKSGAKSFWHPSPHGSRMLSRVGVHARSISSGALRITEGTGPAHPRKGKVDLTSPSLSQGKFTEHLNDVQRCESPTMYQRPLTPAFEVGLLSPSAPRDHAALWGAAAERSPRRSSLGPGTVLHVHVHTNSSGSRYPEDSVERLDQCTPSRIRRPILERAQDYRRSPHDAPRTSFYPPSDGDQKEPRRSRSLRELSRHGRVAVTRTPQNHRRQGYF